MSIKTESKTKSVRFFCLVLLVLVLSVAIIKILYLNWYIHHSPYYQALMWDSVEYDSLAKQYLHSSFWKGEVFVVPPGYPLFLALMYSLFGFSSFPILVIQNILTLITIILIAFIGKTLFNEYAGLIAAGLYSFYGVNHFYDNKLMDNTLVNILLVLALFLFIRGTGVYKFTFFFFIASGIALGMASAIKPNILLMIVLLILYLLFLLRLKGIRYALIMIIGACIILAPIAIRNYHVSRSPVFITAYGGLAFYAGNKIGAKPYFGGLPFTLSIGKTYSIISKYVQEDTGKTMNPAEISTYYYKKGFQFIAHNPGTWFILALHKAILSIANYEQEANYSYDLEMNPFKQFFFVSFAVIFSLAISGLLLRAIGRIWNTKINDNSTMQPRWLLLIPIGVVYITLIMLYAIPRLRTPALPFLSMLAGWSFYELIIENRTYKRILRFGIFIFAFLLSVSIKAPYSMNMQANEYLQYGLAYLNSKDFKNAEYWINKSITLEPSNSKAYAGMALLYKTKEDDIDALEYYKLALRYNENDAEIHNNLASLYFANNNLEKASFHLSRAYQLNPYHPSILYNMALLKIKENNLVEAQHFYDRAMFFGAQDSFGLNKYFGNIRKERL